MRPEKIDQSLDGPNKDQYREKIDQDLYCEKIDQFDQGL
jgi:hypothetical protein